MNSTSSLLASSQRSASPPIPYTTPQSPSNFAAPSGAGRVTAGGGDAREGAASPYPGAGGALGAGAAGGGLVKRGFVDDRKDGKADQIVQHFYAKTCAVVSQARMTHLEDTTASASAGNSSSLGTASGRRSASTGASPLQGATPAPAGPTKRTNRWFNLELPDTDHFRQELRTWRSVSSLLSPAPSPAASLASPPQPVPSMVLDIILDTCSMTPNQVLVLSDQRGRRVRVDSTTSASPPPSGLGHSGPSNLSAGGSSGVRSPRLTRPNVLLERWTLTLVPPFSPSAPPELPSVYKQAIVLFRTLYTLMRTLPAWGLYRRLARRKAGVGGAGLQIGCRMSMGDEGDREGEVGVDVGIAERPGEKTTETIVFPGVQTPTGLLVLQCTYRLNADFAVEAIETLLSSTFIDQDFFKPTMARYHQEALSGRPGSLPSSGRHHFPTTSSSPPGQRTSYGSLSSRHQVPPPSTLPFPSISSAVGVPLPSLEPETPPESASSGGRYGSYTGGIEPAFVSLSRARGASYTGGIQRAGVPLSSSPTSSQPMRRPSFTSSSSGSPIFRAGSYLSSPPLPSSSPHQSGPISNLHRLSSSPRQPPLQTSLPPSTLSSISRSPLAPALTPAQSSGSTPTSPRPILGATPASGRPYSSGSYSRSYGRGSSGGSISGGEASGTWGGRGSGSRLSFEGRYGSVGRAAPAAVIHHTDSPGSESETKRFLEGVQDDSDEINDFLGMIDKRPELVKSTMRGGAAGGSAILSKGMADERLRRLAASVQLVPGSPPSEGYVGGSGGGLGITRASSLRHQSSRQSIKEEPASASNSPSTSPSSHQLPSPSTSPRLPSHLNPSRFARRSSIPPPLAPSPGPSQPSPTTTKYFSSVSHQSPSPSSLTFPTYIPARSVRPVGPSNISTGFDAMRPYPQPIYPPVNQRPALAAHHQQRDSLSGNESSNEDGGGEASGTSSVGPVGTGEYDGGEEEAVGRLELEDEEDESGRREEGERGRGRWDSGGGMEVLEGVVRDDGVAGRERSRDRTPGSTVSRGSRAVRRGYYQRDDEEEDEGRSSPDISWMG